MRPLPHHYDVTRVLRHVAALAVAVCALPELVACHSDDQRQRPGAEDGGPDAQLPLPSRADLPEFCRRPKQDIVRDVFCAEAAPDVRSFADLRMLIGFEFPALEGSPDGNPYGNAYAGSGPQNVLLGHSTALSGKVVSPINPRLILLANASFLAFNRGVQQVELAVRSREDYGLDFYLVTFEQACNASPDGCRPGDLYTPRIESDWTSVRIEDDEGLRNTPSDCRQCHARGRDEPTALMRELDGPWTHFFMTGGSQAYEFPEANGVDLIKDYLAAKGDEPYGGMPKEALGFTVGLILQSSVGFQPLIFDGQKIMNERWPWSPDTGYLPTPTRSATWERGYAAFKHGDQLAQPHFDPRGTDPAKQARLTQAYTDYRNGTLAAEALPDLADIFPDDPQTRAEIGLETEPAATPAEALVQACAQCHNDVLDQSISRARFNVDLSRMSTDEIAVAVERLSLPRGAEGAMPPEGFRQVYEAKRTELVEYLRAGVRTSVDDELLGHAASVGMAAMQPADQRPGP
jgi:hypothetical protein